MIVRDGVSSYSLSFTSRSEFQKEGGQCFVRIVNLFN